MQKTKINRNRKKKYFSDAVTSHNYVQTLELHKDFL